MILIKSKNLLSKLITPIGLIILFGFLYYLCDLYSNYKIESPLEYLYFSLITQTTVGYGNYHNYFLQKYNMSDTKDKVGNKLFYFINSLQLLSIFVYYLI